MLGNWETDMLKHFIGGEVFLAGTDNGGPLYICVAIELLKKWLKEECTLTMDTGMRAFQGFLTYADTIPGSLKGKNAYIIAEDQEQLDSGVIIDNSFDDPDFVAAEIEGIIGGSIGSIVSVELENVFILYGHELPISMTVSQDDVDEEIMDVCKNLALDAMEIKERNEQS